MLNMGNIRKKRPYEGPILNIHKMYYRLSLNKTFGTHSEEAMVFKTLKK